MAFALFLLCALGACSVTSPSDLTSQTFQGTIAPGSAPVTFPFSTSKTGEFVAKITALSPDSGAAVGVGYGQFLSGSCSVISVTSPVGPNGTPAFDFQLPKGDYCVQVFDTGLLPAGRTQSFTLVVSHL